MTKESKCKGCGQPIVWVKTSKGKNMPVDPEEVTIITMGGVTYKGRIVHWVTCPESDQFKKKYESTQGISTMQWQCPECKTFNLNGHTCVCGIKKGDTDANRHKR